MLPALLCLANGWWFVVSVYSTGSEFWVVCACVMGDVEVVCLLGSCRLGNSSDNMLIAKNNSNS